jgi:exopolyphosphatase/guanosine-5'-triphosphate,3'-diphosphate pyrophosphatase
MDFPAPVAGWSGGETACMEKLSIIDIGSNSIRMIILQVQEDGSYKLIDEVKECVRLGDRMNGESILLKEKMNYAIDTLRFFLDLNRALSVENIICVATEAVRRATNRDVFLELAKKQLDLDIRVLTGTEEASYDFIAAASTIVLPDCLIMDIGGSSTELIRVIDNRIAHSVSLPFGAISISQKFQLESAVSAQTIKDMRRDIRSQFKKLDWIYGVDTLIGIGGSFRNLAKIDQKRKNYPLDLAHNYELTPEDVDEISARLFSLSGDERKKIKGLSNDRATIFPGALAEVGVLLDLTGISQVLVSGSGLREGLFYEWLLRDSQPVGDVFGFSILNVMHKFNINQAHARTSGKLPSSSTIICRRT